MRICGCLARQYVILANTHRYLLQESEALNSWHQWVIRFYSCHFPAPQVHRPGQGAEEELASLGKQLGFRPGSQRSGEE